MVRAGFCWRVLIGVSLWFPPRRLAVWNSRGHLGACCLSPLANEDAVIGGLTEILLFAAAHFSSWHQAKISAVQFRQLSGGTAVAVGRATGKDDPFLAKWPCK